MKTKKNNCIFCTLYLCEHNDRGDSHCTSKRNYQKECFIQTIGSKRPIECAGCVARKNPGKWEEKFEKLVRDYQIFENNSPCFSLGGKRCNKIGS